MTIERRTYDDVQSTLSSVKPGMSRVHSPVTLGNAADDARCGHAGWHGDTLTFTGEGRRNYWFIPAVESSVSFAVLVPDTLAIGGYVVSDNYGGCEYHVAVNSSTMELALLHVFRGASGLTKYSLGPGWVMKAILRSHDLVAKIPYKVNNPGQRDGSVLSISYIPPCRIWKNFKIENEFICVKAGIVTHALWSDIRDSVIG